MFAAREHTTQKTAPRATSGLHNTGSVIPQPGSSEFLQRHLGNNLFQQIATMGSPVVQRKCTCGGTCAQCSGRDEDIRRVQTKLKVGPADDVYEREADRVADEIMRMPEPRMQRQVEGPEEEEEELIQTKPLVQHQSEQEEEEEEQLQLKPLFQHQAMDRDGPRQAVDADMEVNAPRTLQAKERPGQATGPERGDKIGALRQAGRPMPDSTRAFFEARFGIDFNQVRVHTGPQAANAARALKARAFTLGHDVVFGTGEYAPDSPTGRHLLAHELTHVVQQRGGSQAISRVQCADVVQRAISPELDKIESYLSYGFFDWAITDAEAIKALELLKTLPRYQQAIFFANRKYMRRLRDNLPEGRVQELSDLQSAAAPITPASATVEDIRSKLSYGLFDWVVTDKEAIDALEMLKQLSGNQLAVALGAIDYGRLMDNLPDHRKQELIDLLARGLGTGGIRQTEEKQHPGAVINSLAFKSDHGVLKDETENWSSGGTIYPQPEWSVSGGKVISHPISHTKDSNIDVDLNLNVMPISAPTAPIKILGKSDVGFLSFSHSGTMKGGLNQTVSMTSIGKLPNKITAFQDKRITWIMEWRNWKREIGRTGGHTVFVTMGKPRVATEATHKRMALAVRLAGSVGTLNPHELVRSIMVRWPRYNLDIFFDNAWNLAENMERGADCGTLARFVHGIIQIVDVPGTATAVVVYALPSTPDTGREDPWGTPGIGLYKVPFRRINDKDAVVRLLDGNDCQNMYEAALKFEESGTLRYYPGGVPFRFTSGGTSRRVEYKTINDVLHIFRCLSWISSRSRIEMVEKNYPVTASVPFPKTPCVAGARLRCK